MSSGAHQYVTLQKYFSHPSLVIYFFPTPYIQFKLLLQISRRLLIGNDKVGESLQQITCRRIIMIDQSEIRSSTCNQIIFITVFSGRGQALLCHLPTSANYKKCQALRQTGIFIQTLDFRLFFIRVLFAGSHNKHQWSCICHWCQWSACTKMMVLSFCFCCRVFFATAFIFLIVGAIENHKHLTKPKNVCAAELKSTVFALGAAFTFLTMLMSELYCILIYKASCASISMIG